MMGWRGTEQALCLLLQHFTIRQLTVTSADGEGKRREVGSVSTCRFMGSARQWHMTVPVTGRAQNFSSMLAVGGLRGELQGPTCRMRGDGLASISPIYSRT